MKKSKILKYSSLYSLAALIYIILVALLIQNGNKLFGKVNNLLSAMAFLLLFVVSAAIVGTLVLAKPIMMYLDGDKKEAIRLFLYILGWMLIFTVIVFIILIII